MASVHDAPGAESGWVRILTTDFCPWANRFLYWLKEPIGWFAVAILIGLLIGLVVDPIGWTIAGALLAFVTVGLVWPALAVVGVQVQLAPSRPTTHEGTACELIVTVRNQLPLPIWGLAIEGFLDRDRPDATSRLPSAALAFVPAWSRAEYRMTIVPELRGHYPKQPPQLACAFPFGIWTARRRLHRIDRLTVWPRIFAVRTSPEMRGVRQGQAGDGLRTDRSGEIIGLRPFRQGDTVRQIHWVATARCGELIVTERGGPEALHVEVRLDPTTENAQEFARRVRIVASLLAHLHTLPIRLTAQIGQKSIEIGRGSAGLHAAWDTLAAVPRDGLNSAVLNVQSRAPTCICVEAGQHSSCSRIQIAKVSGSGLRGHSDPFVEIGPQTDLAEALARLFDDSFDRSLRGGRHACSMA